MSHSVIIIDRDGNSTTYFPPHDGDLPEDGSTNKTTVDEYDYSNPPFIVCHFGTPAQVDQWRVNARMNTYEKTSEEMSEDVMTQVKEIFG